MLNRYQKVFYIQRFGGVNTMTASAMAELERKRQEPRARLSRRVFGQPKVWVPAAAALLAAIIGYGLWAVLAQTQAPVSYAGTLEIRVTDAQRMIYPPSMSSLVISRFVRLGRRVTPMEQDGEL